MSDRNQRSIASAAVGVTAILAVSKIFGFVRSMVMTAKFGTNIYADAYNLAEQAPILLQSLIMAGIVATFIPIYTDILAKKDKRHADRFANKVLTAAVLFTAILVVICMAGSGVLAQLIGVKASAEKRDIMAHLIRILLPLLVFTAIFVVFQNYLNAHRKHGLAQMTGFPLNFVSITFMLLLADTMGIDALAWGTMLGTAGQALLMWLFARRDFRVQPQLDLKDENLRRMLIMMLPALISATATDIATATDKILTGGIDGGPAALGYAWRLNNLVIGSVSVAATSIVYTRLSQLASNNDMDAFKAMLRNSLLSITAVMAPIVVVAMIMDKDIVSLVYERGEFDANSTQLTAEAFLFYAPSILGASIRDIMVRGFYAIGDTRTPLVNGLITVVLNIALNIALVEIMGVGGIALATSISYFFGGFLTAGRMSRKVGGLGLKSMVGSLMKTASCIAVQIVVTIAVSTWMGGTGVFVRLVATALASLAAYGVVGYITDAPGVKAAVTLVTKRLRRS